MFIFENLKHFNFSGFSGKGWMERVDLSNPRIVDVVIQSSLSDFIRNEILSVKETVFIEGAFSSSHPSAATNRLFTIPFFIKLRLKIHGVKILKKTEAVKFIEENLIVPSSAGVGVGVSSSSPRVVLPNVEDYGKRNYLINASSSSSFVNCSYQYDEIRKSLSKHELTIQILSEKCKKTGLNLCKILVKSEKNPNLFIPFENFGVLKNPLIFRRIGGGATAGSPPFRKKQKGFTATPPTRKKAFCSPSSVSVSNTTKKPPLHPNPGLNPNYSSSPTTTAAAASPTGSTIPPFPFVSPRSTTTHFTSTTTDLSASSSSDKERKCQRGLINLPPVFISTRTTKRRPT